LKKIRVSVVRFRPWPYCPLKLLIRNARSCSRSRRGPHLVHDGASRDGAVPSSGIPPAAKVWLSLSLSIGKARFHLGLFPLRDEVRCRAPCAARDCQASVTASETRLAWYTLGTLSVVSCIPAHAEGRRIKRSERGGPGDSSPPLATK